MWKSTGTSRASATFFSLPFQPTPPDDLGPHVVSGSLELGDGVEDLGVAFAGNEPAHAPDDDLVAPSTLGRVVGVKVDADAEMGDRPFRDPLHLAGRPAAVGEHHIGLPERTGQQLTGAGEGGGNRDLGPVGDDAVGHTERLAQRRSHGRQRIGRPEEDDVRIESAACSSIHRRVLRVGHMKRRLLRTTWASRSAVLSLGAMTWTGPSYRSTRFPRYC